LGSIIGRAVFPDFSDDFRNYLWSCVGVRVFENRALRGILGLKRDEVMRGWRQLHNRKLRDLYSSNV
jgi:hypothetical protein